MQYQGGESVLSSRRDAALSSSYITYVIVVHLAGQMTYLVLIGSSDPDKQTTTPDRRDDLARTVCAQNEPHVVHVLLHRPS